MVSEFKRKYNTDENFKAKHKLILKKKIECPECNKLVSRSNMNHHKKSKKHEELIKMKLLEQKANIEINRLKNIIEQLKSTTNTEQYEEILINV